MGNRELVFACVQMQESLKFTCLFYSKNGYYAARDCEWNSDNPIEPLVLVKSSNPC